MDLFKKEYKEAKEEFDVIDFKDQSKHLRALKQRGSSNIKRDSARKALAPGKRISSTGKIYFESRKNRSDKPGSNL